MSNTKDAPIKVGQTVYRQMIDTTVESFIVARVGKKYFYLEGYMYRTPFDRVTLKAVTVFSPIQLYRTAKEILDMKERGLLTDLIRSHFSPYNHNLENTTLEQLRAVAVILKLDNKTKTP